MLKNIPVDGITFVFQQIKSLVNKKSVITFLPQLVFFFNRKVMCCLNRTHMHVTSQRAPRLQDHQIFHQLNTDAIC